MEVVAKCPLSISKETQETLEIRKTLKLNAHNLYLGILKTSSVTPVFQWIEVAFKKKSEFIFVKQEHKTIILMLALKDMMNLMVKTGIAVF